ncbi:hypothetical protein [Methyloceanibacter sp.]|uniref:hypothetical protein n=1 Tax=Methyloceanibacter sp. TaxID=1965321 RepID=UPI003C76BB75
MTGLDQIAFPNDDLLYPTREFGCYIDFIGLDPSVARNEARGQGVSTIPEKEDDNCRRDDKRKERDNRLLRADGAFQLQGESCHWPVCDHLLRLCLTVHAFLIHRRPQLFSILVPKDRIASRPCGSGDAAEAAWSWIFSTATQEDRWKE